LNSQFNHLPLYNYSFLNNISWKSIYNSYDLAQFNSTDQFNNNFRCGKQYGFLRIHCSGQSVHIQLVAIRVETITIGASTAENEALDSVVVGSGVLVVGAGVLLEVCEGG